MVTKWKKGKKIRAFLYRMIATAALVTAIGTGIMGREAFVEAYRNNFSYEMFTGEITYLREFKAFVAEMYNKAMIGYVGVGDNVGYPLNTKEATKYSEVALKDFRNMIDETSGDILYSIEGFDSNFSFPLFSELDGHLLLAEDTKLCCYWNGDDKTLYFFGEWDKSMDSYEPYERYYAAQYKPNKDNAEKLKMVIAVKEECTSPLLAQMQSKAEKYSYIMTVFCISAGVWLLFTLLGMLTAKAAKCAKKEYGEVTAKVWLEVKLILLAAVCFVVCRYDLECFASRLTLRLWLSRYYWMYFPAACIFYLLYVDVRENGVRVLINSLPVKIGRIVVESVRGMKWYRRAICSCALVFGCGVAALVAGAFLFSMKINAVYVHLRLRELLTFAAILLLVLGIVLLCIAGRQLKFIRELSGVIDKIRDMRDGKGDVPLVLPKRSLFAPTAQALNELESGIETAVEEQNRSNRMKVELITNVSHDLKTPLTAIINYADLLCEESLEEPASEYAVALRTKAYRLKNMVQDVFDLSKATSGNLTVEKATIDLVKLIKQTLADMDEKIQESNLTFKLNIAKEPLLIEADGEKLYRVFQNLFVNALQYSLENSRVHVQLQEEAGYAVAKVKNTSRLELDFDKKEIVERFVRADSSRTTEGSGLGLSIVQSFAEACGGEFMIDTDADMFTACVRFPLVQPGDAVAEEHEELSDEV